MSKQDKYQVFNEEKEEKKHEGGHDGPGIFLLF